MRQVLSGEGTLPGAGAAESCQQPTLRAAGRWGHLASKGDLGGAPTAPAGSHRTGAAAVEEKLVMSFQVTTKAREPGSPHRRSTEPQSTVRRWHGS